MGLSFNGIGTYVGWSNLFDYSSKELLDLSEYLPMPSLKVYLKSEIGKNIDEYITKIDSATDRLNELKAYCELLNYLEENEEALRIEIKNNKGKVSSRYLISYTHPKGDEVLQNINLHEFTLIPYGLKEDAIKNFISSHILNTVQNVRNFIGAYSPIDMEEVRGAADLSPKGQLSGKMTLLNPATKLLMLYQNITGKNVIGIAANGEKASFMWHFYLNDIIKNPNIKAIERAKFSFRTDRIMGRAKGNPTASEVQTLPELDFTGVAPVIKAMFSLGPTQGKTYRPFTVDLMISLVLSAATDNAKELILAKINAGNKLAKMYLFMITLGYDIKDIVSFMTSPVASFIDAVSEPNIFTGLNLSVDDAVKIAKGSTKGVIKKLMGDFYWNRLPESTLNKLDMFNFADLDLSSITFGSHEYTVVLKALHQGKEIASLLNYELNQENLADAAEFERILEGANEFSALGTILGLNLGLATSKIDLLKQLNKIAKPIKKRTGKDIDMARYLKDEEYREEIIDLYNAKKICVNPLDVLNHIPHFEAILKIMSAVVDIDTNLAVKSRIYNKVYLKLIADGYYLTDEYQLRLLDSIDDIFISNFIMNSNILIAYPENTTIVTPTRSLIKAPASTIDFKNITDMASFKYIFENTLIPKLKLGKYYRKHRDGSIQEVYDPDLITNPFIKDLIKGNNREIPVYKVNLNMLTLDNNEKNQEKFLKYLRGLSELQKIEVNGYKLADLFVLYNLIVNKNGYGADKFTTLFDKFVQSDSNLSIIKKYLEFVGDLDYNAKLDQDSDIIQLNYKDLSIKVSINDLLSRSAKIVSSLNGVSDPVVLFKVEDRYVYVNGKTKQLWDKMEVLPIKDETTDEYYQRWYINKAFFVLGGSYLDFIENRIEDIRTLSSKTTDVLWNMMREGLIRISKVCE